MLQDTIFSPSFGNRPSSLVGRGEIISAFELGLASAPGARERALVLLGQRGSGKTTLLWELADRARAHKFVVASPTVTTDDMLVRIVEKIQDDGARVVPAGKKHVSGASVGALGFTAGLQFTPEVQDTKTFQYKLLQLTRAINAKGYGVLVLVDELQANSAGVKQLVCAYQEIVGERANIAMVLAGLPAAVSSTLNDKVLTFLNRANKETLGPLRTGDVAAFFDDAFKKLGVKITPGAAAAAVDSVFGSPYMMQLVGHNIVLAAGDGGAIDDAAVARAVAAAQHDFENDICQTTLAALSGKDVEFLQAMAQDTAASTVADVAQRMGVGVDYAQKYRRRLLEAGVIEAPRRGCVQFAVPYLQAYLQNSQL